MLRPYFRKTWEARSPAGRKIAGEKLGSGRPETTGNQHPPETETPMGGSHIFGSSSRDRRGVAGIFFGCFFFAGGFFLLPVQKGFWFGSATKPGVSVEKDTDSFYFC